MGTDRFGSRGRIDWGWISLGRSERIKGVFCCVFAWIPKGKYALDTKRKMCWKRNSIAVTITGKKTCCLSLALLSLSSYCKSFCVCVRLCLYVCLSLSLSLFLCVSLSLSLSDSTVSVELRLHAIELCWQDFLEMVIPARRTLTSLVFQYGIGLGLGKV